MGATDPKEAKRRFYQKRVCLSIEANSVHGSDSIQNAKRNRVFFLHNEELIEN